MTMIEPDGPPRPVRPTIGTLVPVGHDVVRRLPCAALAYDCEGAEIPCQWRAAMTWHGIPFCPRHAPRRTPGVGGWCLL